MEDASNLAERAIMLDPYDARALTMAGHVRAFLHRRLREAAALHERALVLNPNLPMAWALSAATHVYMGDIDEAERRNNRYKKLSPLDPHAFLFDAIFTLIHLLRRDYEAAVIAGRSNTQVGPLLTAGTEILSFRAWTSRTHAGGCRGTPPAAGHRARDSQLNRCCGRRRLSVRATGSM